MMLPVLTHHIRYHQCLMHLDKLIGYMFKERCLLQVCPWGWVGPGWTQSLMVGLDEMGGTFGKVESVVGGAAVVGGAIGWVELADERGLVSLLTQTLYLSTILVLVDWCLH